MVSQDNCGALAARFVSIPTLLYKNTRDEVSCIQVCLSAGSYEGPIASFPSDAAGQAEAVQNAAATPRARSRLANVGASFSCPLPLPSGIPFAFASPFAFAFPFAFPFNPATAF